MLALSFLAWVRRMLSLLLIFSKVLRVLAVKEAFGAFLCDDNMIDAAKILTTTLLRNTSHDLFIMTLSNVGRAEELEKLGAKIISVNELEYPFALNAEKTSINKMCRYSKLNLWALPYDKIVYLDLDMLVLKVVSMLFSSLLMMLSISQVPQSVQSEILEMYSILVSWCSNLKEILLIK